MKQGFRLLVWLSLVVPIPAFAQWNIAGYIGKAHTQSANVHVVQSPNTDLRLRDVAFDDRSFDPPVYYGFRAGYMFSPWVGVEGEFFHMKVYARTNELVSASGTLSGVAVSSMIPPSAVFQQYQISHGLNLLLGNIAVRMPLRSSSPAVTFAGRAGLGVTIAHPEIRAFGAVVDEYQRHGAAFQVAAGLEVGVTDRVFWLAEYKFTHTHPRFEAGTGTIENAFSAHHAVTGLGFRF